MNDVTIEFGPTGIADAGARLRLEGSASARHLLEGPAFLRHLMDATQPHLAGEQLR